MKNTGNKRKLLITAAATTVLIALCLIGAGYAVSNSSRSFPNLYVGNIQVGGMTENDILLRLSQNGWDIKATSVLNIKSFCGTSQEFEPLKAGILSDSKTISAAVVKYGKDGNIFENLKSYIDCMKSEKDINSLYAVADDEYIDSTISLLQDKINEKTAENHFTLDKDSNTLSAYKGYGNTIELNKDKLKADIIELLKQGENEYTFLEAINGNVDSDLARLSELACTLPIDAHFSTDGSHEIVEAQDGYSFDISEAEKLFGEKSLGQEVLIPLTATKANTFAKDLEPLMYRDLIGAMTTKYNNSNENRSSNVRLATSLVNGTVVFPGEEFSFNKVVGKRTEEAGFLMAPAYAGYGDMKDEIGGGVCQVSTGVYASALFAFLEITSHTCHVYPPNYIQLGTDATVSIPDSGKEIDMKFKNNKSFPIKIVGYCEETEDEKTGKPSKKVTIEIWGTLEDTDYMPVEFDNAWGDVYDYDRKIDPAYPDRAGYRIQFTHDETEFEDETGKGLRTLTYRRVYDENGVVVEKTILNKKYSFGYGMGTYYYKE